MVLRRCPQCGTTTDDQYGFCIKCGWEFEKIARSQSQCPLCGFENPEEADYCVKCGSPLLFKNQYVANDGEIKPIVINDTAGNEREIKPIVINKTVTGDERPSRGMRWLVIFGYIFSILGGLLGLIIALYLVTRKNNILRKHGIIQLAIFAFYIVLIAALYATGMIPPETFTNYRQLILGNFTLP